MKITEEILIDNNYKKYESENNYLFQKKIADELGIKYFINIYRYDFTHIENYPKDKDKILYLAELDSDSLNGHITLHLHIENKTVEEIETFFESTWQKLECSYYEKKESNV